MRIINHPDIEIHELDRSGYDDQQDNAIVGTASMVIGFADKGPDYTTKWINTMNTFINTYGYPKSEAETYFFNSAYEVLKQGGYLFTSKLPYDNDSLDKFSFTRYDVDTDFNALSSPNDLINNPYNYSLPELNVRIINDIKENIQYLYRVLSETQITDITNIEHLKVELMNLLAIVEQEGSIDKIDDMVKSLNIIRTNIKINASINNLLQLNFTTLDDVDTNLSANTKYSEDVIQFIKDSIVIPYECQDYFDNILSERTSLFCVRYICDQNYTQIKGYVDTYVPEVVYDEELTKKIVERIQLRFKNYKEMIETFNRSKLLSEFKSYYNDLRNKSKESLINLMDAYVPQSFVNVQFSTRYSEIKKIDDFLTSYTRIYSCEQNQTGMITMDQFDKFKTMEDRVPKNSIYFVDATRRKYQKDNDLEYIGVVPVVTTAANAMFYQGMIDANNDNYSDYNVIKDLQNRKTKNSLSSLQLEKLNNDIVDGSIAGFSYNLGGEENVNISYDEFTTSRKVAEYFPKMKYNNNRVDIENLKKIGVVVLLAYKDTGNDNRISFVVSESFVGSLKRSDRSENGNNIFIDDVINANSKLIKCFSNIDFTNKNISDSSIFLTKNQSVTSLGFYEAECAKTISYKKSIINSLERVFDRNQDINTSACDILIDGGVSTIAQFIKQIYKDGVGEYDPTGDNSFLFNIQSKEDVQAWKTVITKYDEFCKSMRKDCMFLADSPRSLVLVGNEKQARDTNPEATFKKKILPKLKYVSGIINSSYGAGYLNWFKSVNHYNNEMFWCPPSIKAAGVYIYTDARTNYWNAPAGLNRGKIQDAYDISFNATDSEQDEIYTNTWNYAINYPMHGIVLEGQKTFQRDKTAMDRVNVRRLFLRLEKSVRRKAKFFTYEGITEYMMTRFVDTIDPLFRNAQDSGGIKEYYIVCDGRNNNVTTIENNELHCTIAVKPIKSLEFLVLNFIATTQGASVTEVAESEL